MENTELKVKMKSCLVYALYFCLFVIVMIPTLILQAIKYSATALLFCLGYVLKTLSKDSKFKNIIPGMQKETDINWMENLSTEDLNKTWPDKEQ